ncbi:unnamed protein product [Ophioblennius macclurei]
MYSQGFTLLTLLFMFICTKVSNVVFLSFLFFLCPSLRELFLRQSSPNQTVHEINDTTPAIMELIIKFAYTGSFPVMVDNVQALMLAAHKYSITDIVQTCSHFLEEKLCPENCIGVWQFTNAFNSLKLHLKAFRYILDHFQRVVFGEEFLQLTAEELVHLIGRDDLIVKTENTVYQGVMRWIAHEPNQRKEHLYKLMSKIRLCLMDVEYMRIHVLSNDLVNNHPQCLNMVTKASRIRHCILNNRVTPIYSNPFVRPRLPDAILFVAGGYMRGHLTNTIETYDFRVNQWVSLTASGEHLRGHRPIAFLNGYVYYIGGLSREGYLSSVHRFDPITKTFREVAPMHSQRSNIGVTVLNGVIYAVGGHDGRRALRSAEYYQPQTNQWSLIAPMQKRRRGAGCTVLNEKVFIFGGFNGHETLESAEYYNPPTNQWTTISSMNCPRRGLGAVAYENHIYVVGGFDDAGNCLSSAELYDPLTDNWTDLPPMKTNRSNFGVEVLEDCIFVVGGTDGFDVIKPVEVFDLTLNQWTEACDMSTPHPAPSCCVVYGLPNMDDYTFSRESLPLLDWETEEKEETQVEEEETH